MFLEFNQCTFGEKCEPFQGCEPLKKIVEKGLLTPEERNYLRSKQCNSINRVAYVCCPSGSSTGAAAPAPPSNLKTLPKAPDCGISLHDRVRNLGSFVNLRHNIKISFYDSNLLTLF